MLLLLLLRPLLLLLLLLLLPALLPVLPRAVTWFPGPLYQLQAMATHLRQVGRIRLETSAEDSSIWLKRPATRE